MGPWAVLEVPGDFLDVTEKDDIASVAEAVKAIKGSLDHVYRSRDTSLRIRAKAANGDELFEVDFGTLMAMLACAANR
jgi:hypothetical protein